MVVFDFYHLLVGVVALKACRDCIERECAGAASQAPGAGAGVLLSPLTTSSFQLSTYIGGALSKPYILGCLPGGMFSSSAYSGRQADGVQTLPGRGNESS